MAEPFGRAGSLRPAYDAVDWAATALGPVEGWDPTLVGAVDLVLRTRFPATLFWGPELVLVYNEAYVDLIGDKHPAALGARTEDVFPEAWEQIGPLMERVLAGGEAPYLVDLEVPLYRRGFLEECWFTFCYSGVAGPDGVVQGVLDIATETTRQVVDRRRLELLALLTARLGEAADPEELSSVALDLLRDVPADVVSAELTLPGTSNGRDAHALTLPAASLTDGVLRLPLVVAGDRTPGELAVRLNDRLAVDETYVEFLDLVAAVVTRQLDRLLIHDADRRLSLALQQSLLSAPLQPDHLHLASRYLPAVETAQVGGDWYDAFLGPDGALVLAVGDVAGHDRDAAAAMGQVRNLLRGIAYGAGDAPAALLAGLDRAMDGLAVGAFASAVVLRLEQDADAEARGLRVVRWSNAGHPPPVLLAPDGTATALERDPELLLGLAPGTARTEQTLCLEPGSSVVLYTDGLVERRGASLDDGIGWLVAALSGRQDLDAESLADHVVGMLPPTVEDDVVVLVLHAYREDRPRPAVAGPEILP